MKLELWPAQVAPQAAPAEPADATSEVAQLRAQVRQLEQDVVSAALATNDDQIEALQHVSNSPPFMGRPSGV